MKTKKILLFNDTSEDNNPGCKSTVHGLNKQFKKTDYVIRISKGFGYNYFYNCYTNPFDKKGPIIRRFFNIFKKINYLISNSSKIHKHQDNNVPKISLKLWFRALNKVQSRERKLIELLQSCDEVVINMEGTIHHNSVGALTLLGIAYLGKKYNKKTVLVNGSIQSMDQRLLNIVLSNLDKISVREVYSLRYLNSLGINSQQAADCAFLTDINTPFDFSDRIKYLCKDACLFSPGILASRYKKSKKYLDYLRHFLMQLKKKNQKIVYFRVDNGEGQELILLANNLNIPIIYASEIPWSSIGSFLKHVSCLISGRYHLLIFALMSQVPIVAIGSNSWKIEGLLDLIGDLDFKVLDIYADTMKPKEIMATLVDLDLAEMQNLALKNYP